MHVRPHLEYGDVIFHNCSQTLMHMIESIQYQAGLIVTGCWKGTSRYKLFKELGWETLADRRNRHRLSLYYKIKTDNAPDYLNSYVLNSTPEGTDRYKRSFFPYCYNEWNSLDQSLRTTENLNKFKQGFLKAIRPEKRCSLKFFDKYGLSLLTRLRVEFSDLREHRFNHKFNCSDPVCKCGREEETTTHYLLRCPLYSTIRTTLMSNISNAINPEILNIPHDHLNQVLLYGSNAYNEISNRIIIESTIRFIKDSSRFNIIEAYS